jgi:hypothetical protein
MDPRYPVYVISKGRWESRLTSRFLEKAAVPYRIVVEPQEYGRYAAVIDPAKILTLPFSDLGLGSIPARNWVWEHAVAEGHRRHWILDDNISGLCYFTRNTRHWLRTGTGFVVMEDFVDRYENVALAGPQYDFFMPRRAKRTTPLTFNTRIYSFILIDHALPFRWRGRYNEDTDLSLRALKDGWCTVLFLAILQKKMPTMSIPGGNTESLYKLSDGRDGRLLMAQSLQQQHPDVVRITRKWGRWQHQVDYQPFRGNQLIRRPGVVIPDGPNDYGLRLVLREKPEAKTASPRESVVPALAMAGGAGRAP